MYDYTRNNWSYQNSKEKFGSHSVVSLQQAAMQGTSHFIYEVQQSETWSLSGGGHLWFKRSTGKKRPVTRDDIKYDDDEDNSVNDKHHHHHDNNNNNNNNNKTMMTTMMTTMTTTTRNQCMDSSTRTLRDHQ